MALTPSDTLVVALSSEPVTLDPRLATDANGVRIGALIFSSLVRLGPNLDPVPDAAERWTVHGRTCIFYVRPDLRFHNGREVTKEDLEFSFSEALSPRNPHSSMLSDIKNVAVDSIENAHGTRQLVTTIELKTSAVEKVLISELPAIKILPKAEVLADGGAAFSRQLIGTGNFRLKKKDQSEIELEAVHAATAHLIFKIILDDYTRFQKMLKGDIDIAQMEINPDKVPEFERRPTDFQIYRYPGLSMSYVLVNFRNPILKNKSVRLALSESIQRPDIIRYKLRGFAREATSLLTPSNPYFEPGLRNPAYNTVEAKQRIAAEGLLGKTLILKTANSPQAVDNGKVLAYQMSQSGLHVQIQSYEWSTFYSDVKHGSFQLATMRWVGTVDPDIYRMAFHSTEKPPGRNRGSYSNPKLDELLDAATSEPDFSKRKTEFAAVQKLVQDDCAIIPLWYDEQVAVAKRSVANYYPNQTGDFWPLTQVTKTQ